MGGELEDVLGEAHLQEDADRQHASECIGISLHIRAQVADHQEHRGRTRQKADSLSQQCPPHRASDA